MSLKLKRVTVLFLIFLKLVKTELDQNFQNSKVVTIDLKIPENYTIIHPVTTNSRDSRILNGSSASNGQFPFAAFLHIQRGSSLTYCTGSLISSNWIITARSCFV